MGTASSTYGPAVRRDSMMAALARPGRRRAAPRVDFGTDRLLDVAGLLHVALDLAAGLVDGSVGRFRPGQRRVDVRAENGLHGRPLRRPRTPEGRGRQRVGHGLEEGIALVEPRIREDRFPERD